MAKKAEVNVSTIRHYLNEGLIDKPIKTGKTMAYYDESCVDRIKQIKKLQRERFLPLEVIKRILDSGETREEDLELGGAMFKINAAMAEAEPLSEARAASVTGYPLEKIRALARENIIRPSRGEKGDLYGPLSLEIIAIMKQREELGVPFDHCLEIAKAYRDGVHHSVTRDLKIFTTSILGDVTAREAARMMTEADESLDRFIVIYRRLLTRELAADALGALNRISVLKDNLNFFRGLGKLDDLLPAGKMEGPEGIILETLRGNFGEAASLMAARGPDFGPGADAFSALLYLLDGDLESASALAARSWPEPSAKPMDNVAAALDCLFSLAEAKGLSAPIYLVNRMLSFLARALAVPVGDGLEGWLTMYACGAVYVTLPDFFETVRTGEELLSRLVKILSSGEPGLKGVPSWADEALRYHVYPSAEASANGFLAEARLRMGDKTGARAALNRIVSITDPGSERSDWARNKKVEAGV